MNINGVFTVESMCANLVNIGPIFHRQHIRKTLFPVKIMVPRRKQNETGRLVKNVAFMITKKQFIIFLSCPFTTLFWRKIHAA